MQILASKIDRSVNFVQPVSDGGFLESRYVRRCDDYFIVYLSSHSGCRMACRFCHLTASRQTMMKAATVEDFVRQAEHVFHHYNSVIDSQGPAQKVHFNWMARGEPLMNEHLTDDFERVTHSLSAISRGLRPVFNISTILPRSFSGRLARCLRTPEEVTLYYSLYSMRPAFRRKWLPQAMEPHDALKLLAEYQQCTGRPLVLHWAYIEGENDDAESAHEIAAAIKEYGLQAKFNLVRYNNYSPAHGIEPAESRLQECFSIIQEALGSAESRIVPRVGFDVHASCGMFVDKESA